LYVFINLRSSQFNGVEDAFSYLFLSAFALLVIIFYLFTASYISTANMEKWSAKFKEMLIEAPSTKKGALAYHLTFVLRRVAIVINVIMLGALGPNIHISVL